ncbi:hypothetical protein LINPERPRIM_LOCUS30254 [Linum perenne]
MNIDTCTSLATRRGTGKIVN